MLRSQQHAELNENKRLTLVCPRRCHRKPDLETRLHLATAAPLPEQSLMFPAKTLKERTEMLSKKQKGFSLIELLIVVAIILIIAAIAIPNLLRSKMAANESSAVGSLRTITTA